jgi:arylsulfatase A-like enzyme
MPETAKHADKLCILNGMHADTGIHAQSALQLHTGDRLRERPSIGSWINYGLGTENQNLPGFISLNTSRPTVYSSAFLPSIYTGTPIGTNGQAMAKATIENVRNDHLPLSAKRAQLDYVQFLNQNHLSARPGDEKLDSVIRSMELGFRMQTAAPELLDIRTESAATLERYRVGQQKGPVGTCRMSDFGRQCLLARRFAEAGVRFIEVNHGSWDQHKNHRRDLEANCAATDAPIAALLEDLEQRGLLEDTLVVWGGEFGRPGLTPNDGKNETGHNANGFTFWMAGGGVKAGFAFGRTDDTGARAVDGKIHFRDLHATILHQMGLEANDLTYRHAGREHRLTGPEGGRVVREIIA